MNILITFLTFLAICYGCFLSEMDIFPPRGVVKMNCISCKTNEDCPQTSMLYIWRDLPLAIQTTLVNPKRSSNSLRTNHRPNQRIKNLNHASQTEVGGVGVHSTAKNHLSIGAHFHITHRGMARGGQVSAVACVPKRCIAIHNIHPNCSNPDVHPHNEGMELPREMS